MTTEQAAVILLNEIYHPLYVSTAAAQILLGLTAMAGTPAATRAMVSVVHGMLATNQAEGGKRFGVVEANGNSYIWNITRCDEWTSKATPWNYVMMIRNAELPQEKCEVIAQQFGLSPRQQQTLGYLFQGLTSKEIANYLELSPHTVKVHIRALMNKLQVTTRTALVGRVLAASVGESAAAELRAGAYR